MRGYVPAETADVTELKTSSVPSSEAACCSVLCSHRIISAEIVDETQLRQCDLSKATERSVLPKLDSYLLYFAVGKKPDQRFVMQIDHLDAIAPGIAKIASKRRFQFQSILLRDLLADLGNLLLVADH